MLENAWFLLTFIIVAIILSSDPKSSVVGGQKSQLDSLFTSTSDGQKFFRVITWGLIGMFYSTTLLLSYYS